MLIVLDTNVPRHIAKTRAVTVRIRESNWGPIPFRIRHLRTESEWLHTKKGVIAHEVRYAVALALKKDELGIDYAINSLTRLEQWNVRPAFDQAGRDIWNLFDPRTLETQMPDSFVILGGNINFKDTLRDLSNHPNDDRLHYIIKKLGHQNSQDAFHLWNAEQHEAKFFMTMDKKFVHLVEKHILKINSPVKVCLPSSIAAELKIHPVELKWFAQRSDNGIDEWLEPESNFK